MSWRVEFWQVLLQQDEDQADAEEGDASDQGDLDAVTSAMHRQLRAELALEEWRAKRRRHG